MTNESMLKGWMDSDEEEEYKVLVWKTLMMIIMHSNDYFCGYCGFVLVRVEDT